MSVFTTVINTKCSLTALKIFLDLDKYRLIRYSEPWWWALLPYHEATRGLCYTILVELRLVGATRVNYFTKIFLKISLLISLSKSFIVSRSHIEGWPGKVVFLIIQKLALIEMRVNREQK